MKKKEVFLALAKFTYEWYISIRIKFSVDNLYLISVWRKKNKILNESASANLYSWNISNFNKKI